MASPSVADMRPTVRRAMRGRIAAREEPASCRRGNFCVPPGEDADPPRGRAVARYARLMRRQRAIDVGIALAAFAFTLALLAGGGVGPEEPQQRDVDGLGVLLAALSSPPIVFWRRAPLSVYVFTVVASAVMSGLNYAHGPPFGPTAALFILASNRSQVRVSGRVLAGLIVVLFVGHVVATGLATDEFPAVQLLLGASLWTAVWFAGDRVRLRRERITELEERALRA